MRSRSRKRAVPSPKRARSRRHRPPTALARRAARAFPGTGDPGRARSRFQDGPRSRPATAGAGHSRTSDREERSPAASARVPRGPLRGPRRSPDCVPAPVRPAPNATARESARAGPARRRTRLAERRRVGRAMRRSARAAPSKHMHTRRWRGRARHTPGCPESTSESSAAGRGDAPDLPFANRDLIPTQKSVGSDQQDAGLRQRRESRRFRPDAQPPQSDVRAEGSSGEGQGRE